MCGIFGIIGSEDVVAQTYDALLSIQHRGQDAAGILTCEGDEGPLHLAHGEGLVRDALRASDLRLLRGNVALAHTRYPTVGAGGVEDAQPLFVNKPHGIGLVHNGNISNYHQLRAELQQRDSRYIRTGCDAEVLLNVLASELEGCPRSELDEHALFAAVDATFSRAQGAYSAVAFIVGIGLLAFRDPLGIRPMVWGKRARPEGEPDVAFASESGTLSLLGFDQIEPVPPGEAIWVDLNRRVRRQALRPKEPRPCLFEHIYFARPDAHIDGLSVYRSRERLGALLAPQWLEAGVEADVVVPVPDSACTAAQSLARELDLPYCEALVKNRYIGRTFIMPERSDRRSSVRKKLNPIRSLLEGKRVLLVDDSIVRGNTARELVSMVRAAGARAVHLAIASPPVEHPCVYGVDMSTRAEFIARDHTVEQIRGQIGADTLVYLPLAGLEAAVRGDEAGRRFCNACFTGDYPTGDITSEIFAAWESDRACDGGGDSPR